MKILNKILMLGLFLSMAGIFVACGDKEESKIESVSYNVLAEESDFYDINGQTKTATAGSQAYVNISPEFDAVIIDRVMFNGQECIKSETIENRYEFTMPSEDVTITVDFYFVDNKSDNFLTWNTSNDTTFEIFVETEGDTYFSQWDDGELTADVTKNPSQTAGYFTEHAETVFSLSQDVVPNEALSVTVGYRQSTSSAISFTVKIDRTKIHAGEAQIVLLVDNKHKFGDASLLVCTINVVSNDVI